MGTITRTNPGVPTFRYRIDLDAHGFEPDDAAPSQVTADIMHMGYDYELEIRTGEVRWRVQFIVDDAGELIARDVYDDGSLLAADIDQKASELAKVPRWVRFVIEHVRGEVVGE
jgi:hypothetical protein